MTAQQLKASILQLAIQGKLVPQNPADEPASMLLKRIKAEKDALVKAGKIKKEKPLPPISEDEIPFDVPDNWGISRIGDCLDLVNGRAYKQSELLDDGQYRVLRVGNFFTNASWYYSDLELPDEKYCYSGDLLYAWSASFGPRIWNGEKTIFHYHIWNVKFDERLFLKEFLYYFLLWDKERLKESKTGSTMFHVSMEHMKPRLIIVPPLEEQKRIVAKIEHLLPHVAEYGKVETELSKLNAELPELLKKSILQWAIQGRLVPQDPTDEPASELLKRIKAEKAALIKSGKLKKEKPLPPISEDEIPFDIPESWEWVRLGSIGQTNIGLTYKPSDITNDGTGIPVLRSNNIQNGLLDFSDLIRVSCVLAENLILNETDILICARNGSKSLVGKCAVIPLTKEALSFGAFMAVFRSPLNKWIFQVLNSAYYRNYLFGSNSTQICQLTQEMLKRFLVPIPPLAEQKRIVDKLETVLIALGNKS